MADHIFLAPKKFLERKLSHKYLAAIFKAQRSRPLRKKSPVSSISFSKFLLGGNS